MQSVTTKHKFDTLASFAKECERRMIDFIAQIFFMRFKLWLDIVWISSYNILMFFARFIYIFNCWLSNTFDFFFNPLLLATMLNFFFNPLLLATILYFFLNSWFVNTFNFRFAKVIFFPLWFNFFPD